MIVRVVCDVPALGDRELDYLVPDQVVGHVRVGTLVRVPLQGRRAGAWVVEVDVVPSVPATQLKPLAKVTGWGPPADVVELCRWTAWRWAGRWSTVLTTASPDHAVTALPAVPHRPVPPPTPVDARAGALFGASGTTVLRVPPAGDVLPVVQAAASAAAGQGSVVVVAPSADAARLLAVRLRRAGVDTAVLPRDWARAAAGRVVALGARAAVFAPVPDLAAIVVVDEHDDALKDERVPCWHARDVAVERARRAGVPCVLVSPCPTVDALVQGPLKTVGRTEERAGWPVPEVVDLGDVDPFTRSLLSVPLTRRLQAGGRAVCVLNRAGGARVLACAGCRALARCERCDAALREDDAGLACGRCGLTRPVVCAACGRTRMRTVRAGTARVRTELEALLGEPVAEVTARSGPEDPGTRVVVGTEAVLHRVGDAEVVAVLDFDAELFAPRLRAAEQAFALLARCARLLGPRERGGRLLVQTAHPDHEVVRALLVAEPSRVAALERDRRILLGFPPFAAVAEVSGGAAAAWVAGLEAAGIPLGIHIQGPADDRWLVRAPRPEELAAFLAQATRPAGRLRVEVDPLRV